MLHARFKGFGKAEEINSRGISEQQRGQVNNGVQRMKGCECKCLRDEHQRKPRQK